MKLHDLDRKNVAIKALKESFDYKFDTDNLNHAKTKTMLVKVRSLIKEAKSRPDFYKNNTSESYLKMLFMEQALSKHLSTLKTPRIVVENEEVEKSQVILAAQDMVDSVQKMIEEVNDMLVKELPALTDSIQSEIGVNESSAFNQQASTALTTLNQTLSQSLTDLKSGLNSLTGIGAGDFSMPDSSGEEIAVTDIGTDSGDGQMDLDVDVDAELPAQPEEEPELPAVGGVGRAKR